MSPSSPVHESATVLDQPTVSNGTKPSFIHPLDCLYPAEITEISNAFKRKHAQETLRFKFITALEPPKRDLTKYLNASRSGETVRPLPRLANLLYSAGLGDKMHWHEGVYDLGKQDIVTSVQVEAAHKSQGDPDEVIDLEQIVLKDESFQKALKKLNIPEGAQIVADPWIYGSDTTKAIPRLVTYMVYYRPPGVTDVDTNHYSYPIPLCPVIDTNHLKIVDIIHCPTGGYDDGLEPGTLDEAAPVDHHKPSEYMPHLMDLPIRTDLKPLVITQPEGASFTIEGNRIKWQKWDFILSFNYRESIVLHDIHYDGRSVFYRLSLNEMTVPYGDARAPYHRKQAFDAGDAGLGYCANQLDLGCDCLGLIKYFSTFVAQASGEPKEMKNVVCMHEVDDGIQWKHTNYRSNNAAVVRSRHLILQTICTVSNYEYIWIWKFDQAGAIHFETRATGILSTSYIDKGKKSPYGNIVSPGVMAPNHQHAFNIRVDPAIDGHENTVLYEDSVALPMDEKNPYGTAWAVEQTKIKIEGYADAKPLANRIFKMINPKKINPISGKPIGYKFSPHPGALMLAHPQSICFKRAEFGGHHIWVTKYRDHEIFAGGNYTNQSYGNAKGINHFISRGEPVEEDDVVVWHSFCLTHNPRIEDWPVMPYESLTISFKPADFFTQNPSIDVPRSIQSVNQSTAFDGLSEVCCKSAA